MCDQQLPDTLRLPGRQGKLPELTDQGDPPDAGHRDLKPDLPRGQRSFAGDEHDSSALVVEIRQPAELQAGDQQLTEVASDHRQAGNVREASRAPNFATNLIGQKDTWAPSSALSDPVDRGLRSSAAEEIRVRSRSSIARNLSPTSQPGKVAKVRLA